MKMHDQRSWNGFQTASLSRAQAIGSVVFAGSFCAKICGAITFLPTAGARLGCHSAKWWLGAVLVLVLAGGAAVSALAQPAATQIGEPVSASGRTESDARGQAGWRPASLTQRYEHGNPTDYEQYLLELINRARANPLAEAQRLGIDLNEGLPAGTISPDPKSPLGFNPFLILSARNHSQWMLDNDLFSHTGVDNSDPGQRMETAGYLFAGSRAWGENIGWRGTSGNPDVASFTSFIHDSLFRSPGHRKNLMSPVFDELGVGVMIGTFATQGTEYNSVMVTQNFALSEGTPGPLILGVVYRDLDGDGGYSVGEGVASATISLAGGKYYAVTSSSGGYALPCPGLSGSHNVIISGGPLTQPVVKGVQLNGANLKADFDLLKEAPVNPTVAFTASTARWYANGQFACQISGPVGAKIQIEVSSGLGGWSAISTRTLAAAREDFVDDQAWATKMRFYRMTILP